VLIAKLRELLSKFDQLIEASTGSKSKEICEVIAFIDQNDDAVLTSTQVKETLNLLNTYEKSILQQLDDLYASVSGKLQPKTLKVIEFLVLDQKEDGLLSLFLKAIFPKFLFKVKATREWFAELLADNHPVKIPSPVKYRNIYLSLKRKIKRLSEKKPPNVESTPRFHQYWKKHLYIPFKQGNLEDITDGVCLGASLECLEQFRATGKIFGHPLTKRPIIVPAMNKHHSIYLDKSFIKFSRKQVFAYQEGNVFITSNAPVQYYDYDLIATNIPEDMGGTTLQVLTELKPSDGAVILLPGHAVTLLKDKYNRAIVFDPNFGVFVFELSDDQEKIALVDFTKELVSLYGMMLGFDLKAPLRFVYPKKSPDFVQNNLEIGQL